MPRYAVLNGEGVCVGVSNLRDAGMEQDHPNLVRIGDEENPLGMKRRSGRFQAEPAPPTMTVTFDKTRVVAGETVTATVEIRQADGSLAPIDDEHDMPVVSLTNRQTVDVITVSVAGGQGQATFTLNQRGLFTLGLNEMRPRPQSKLAAAPVPVVRG